MSNEGVKPLRFVVSASLKDIYDEDMEGFDAVVDNAVMSKLSDENDAVSGTERFYNYILHNHPTAVTDFGSVSGSESLVDSLKKGIRALIQTVKDFFKWIWSFISGKEEKIDVKLKSVSHLLKDKGVKTGNIPYPNTAVFIYPKPGKPAGELGWVGDANKRIAKGISNAEAYADELDKLLQKLVHLTKQRSPTKEFTDTVIAFNGKVKDIFGLSGRDKGTFITTNDFSFGIGRIDYHPSANRRSDFKGVTFVTSQTAVEVIHKDAEINLNSVKKLTLSLHKLEKDIVDTLTLVSNYSEITSNTHKVFSNVVRDGLSDIKTLSTVLHKAIMAVADICRASIN